MRHPFLIFAGAALLLTGCGMEFHRVPPGQSLSVALAQRGEAMASAPAPPSPRQSSEARNLPVVEPALPQESETVADLMTKATFLLQSGQREEAITAYEQVVRLVPDLAEARYNLAVLYQQAGEEEKALEAFRRYKQLALH